MNQQQKDAMRATCQSDEQYHKLLAENKTATEAALIAQPIERRAGWYSSAVGVPDTVTAAFLRQADLLEQNFGLHEKLDVAYIADSLRVAAGVHPKHVSEGSMLADTAQLAAERGASNAGEHKLTKERIEQLYVDAVDSHDTTRGIIHGFARAIERELAGTIIHASDCAVHNEPAMPAGACDCAIESELANAAPRTLTDEQIDRIALAEHPEGRCTTGSLRELCRAIEREVIANAASAGAVPEAVRIAGAKMANTMFNLSQDADLIPRVPLRESMKAMQQEWDAAWRALEAAFNAGRDSAPAGTVPEGWKPVPVDITEDMHAAAVRAVIRSTGNDDCPPNVWRAMLAAAPVPPVAAPADEGDTLGAKLHSTMDAQVWAKEFCRLNNAADEGMMLSWFANAIMVGYDHAKRQAAPADQVRQQPMTVSGTICEIGELEDEDGEHGIVIKREFNNVTIKGLAIDEMRQLGPAFLDPVTIEIRTSAATGEKEGDHA